MLDWINQNCFLRMVHVLALFPIIFTFFSSNWLFNSQNSRVYCLSMERLNSWINDGIRGCNICNSWSVMSSIRAYLYNRFFIYSIRMKFILSIPHLLSFYDSVQFSTYFFDVFWEADVLKPQTLTTRVRIFFKNNVFIYASIY